MSFSFWHSDVDGVPISLLVELLRAESLILWRTTASAFDLKVLKQYIRDDAEYQSFESKCTTRLPSCAARSDSPKGMPLARLNNAR